MKKTILFTAIAAFIGLGATIASYAEKADTTAVSVTTETTAVAPVTTTTEETTTIRRTASTNSWMPQPSSKDSFIGGNDIEPAAGAAASKSVKGSTGTPAWTADYNE